MNEMESGKGMPPVEKAEISQVPDQGNDFFGRLEKVKSTLIEMGNTAELLGSDGAKIAELTKLFETEWRERTELILKSLEDGKFDEADLYMEELEIMANDVRSVIAKAMELTVSFLKLQSEFRFDLHRK